MLHELRIYTLTRGGAPKFVELAKDVGIPIRGDDYGKLEGFWSTEFGKLNQVVHIWSHESLDARQENRRRLAENKDWTQGFVPKIQPLMLRQEVRFLTPQKPITPLATTGNIYEYRAYRTGVGKAKEWLGHFLEIQPVREKYSQNIGIWQMETPDPNQVSHLWAYPNLEARSEARAKVDVDPEWGEFRKKAGHCLEEMDSIILTPAPFSPLR